MTRDMLLDIVCQYVQLLIQLLADTYTTRERHDIVPTMINFRNSDQFWGRDAVESSSVAWFASSRQESTIPGVGDGDDFSATV